MAILAFIAVTVLFAVRTVWGMSRRPPEDESARFRSHAAGALVKAHEGDLTATQLSRRLFDTATDLGPVGLDDTYGYGLIDANCAVSPDETGC